MTDADVAALTAELRALAAEVRLLRESWACAKASKAPGVASRAPAAYSEAFEAFWDAYACVRRRNKPEAWRQWCRLGLGAGLRAMDALDRYKNTDQWRDGYMPEPARWLKSEPWLDEPTQPSPKADAADPWEPRRQ